MILIIECVVCCLVFHLLIALVHKKDNLLMAGSYPPKVRERLREMGVIPKEQKSRFSKKEIIATESTPSPKNSSTSLDWYFVLGEGTFSLQKLVLVNA